MDGLNFQFITITYRNHAPTSDKITQGWITMRHINKNGDKKVAHCDSIFFLIRTVPFCIRVYFDWLYKSNRKEMKEAKFIGIPMDN